LLKELAKRISARTWPSSRTSSIRGTQVEHPPRIEESFEEDALAEDRAERLLRTRPDDPSFDAKLTALEESSSTTWRRRKELFPSVEKALATVN